MKQGLYDVLEVDLRTMTVTLMGKSKSAENAEAIEKMAIMRRATDDNFFVTVPTGLFRDGDVYRAGSS